MGRSTTLGLVLGLILTLLTRRPWFLVIAVALGFLHDAGVFGPPKQKEEPPAAPPSDPYATLGVSSSASDDEIEQAYRRRMSEYHPDRVANAAQEIRDLAGLRAGEVNAAYETIKRQRGR